MVKPKLPESIREKVKALFGQGYDTPDVFQRIKTEAMLHLQSEDELRRCLAAIKGKAGKATGLSHFLPEKPKRKAFDSRKFESTIEGLHKDMPGKDIESACLPIAKYILKSKEGFGGIVTGPPYPGTPFDLLGFKNGTPYVIEVKTSLEGFHHPGGTQKWRLQELLKRNKGLKVALLQLAVKKRQYRIFYDDQMNIVFFGPKAPLEPIEKWIRERMKPQNRRGGLPPRRRASVAKRPSAPHEK